MTAANLKQHLAAISALPPGALALLSPLTDEAEYLAALEASEELSRMMGQHHGHPLEGVFETLMRHIVAYEDAHYPLPDTPAHQMLGFLLAQQGISQTELAARLGVSQGTVSRLVSGKTQFTAQWIERLAHTLGVSPSVFV